MTAKIELISTADVARLISSPTKVKLSDAERDGFRKCLKVSSVVWVGSADGKLVCIFGLIPPTLADDRAYLWLHTTEAVKDNEFTFVRQSQIAVRKMLESFPTIVGHCEVEARQSRRWVKWLGATFGKAEGPLVPFTIVRKHD